MQQVDDIIQLQHLVDQLYATADPTFAKRAQEYLHNLQKQPIAWDLAPQLLASSSVNCHFFGAHTFQVKISRDWDTIPEDRIPWLRQELLTWLVRLCDGPAFVTTKLCLALTAYALHAVPMHWSNFITDFCQVLQSGAQAQGKNPRNVQIALLEFLTVVPEEVGTADLIGDRKAKINQELLDAIPLVISTLQTFISDPAPLSDADVAVKQKSLRCFQSWVQYGIPLLTVYPLVRLTMALLPTLELFEPAADALLEVMSHPAHASFRRLCEDVLVCVTSDWAKGEFARCVNENDDPFARTLCRLMTTLGENFTDFIACNLLRPDVITYLNMMIGFAGYPGHFGADQEISEIPLNFWSDLQESMLDAEVLNGGVGEDEEELADEEEAARREAREEKTRRVKEAAFLVYRKLVEVLRMKIEYPEEEEWAGWTKDAKDRFRIFRRDVGDTLINSYHVLRDQMLAILVDMAIAQLNVGPAMRWQTLESTLFCVKFISEAVPSRESVYMPRVFGAEIFARLPTDGNYRLRNTALLVIGSYAEWLKSHPDFLLPALNYLVPALSDPRVALAAATGFKDVCDICRDSLIDGIGSLINMYAVVGKNVQPREKQKVIESIADVIQALPPEKMVEPLLALTSDIIQSLKEALVVSKEQDPAQAQPLILAQLEYLTACCRGIQSPDDDYHSSQDRTAIYDQFASGNLGSVFEQSVVARALVTAVGEITQEVAVVWAADENVMRVLCNFLDTGIRTTSPLLSVPFSQLVLLIQTSYQRHPHACWLDTASLVMAVYGGRDGHANMLRDVMASVASKTLEGIRSSEVLTCWLGVSVECNATLFPTCRWAWTAMDQYPDVVSAFFNLLSRMIRRCPLAFYQLPTDVLDTILMFAVAGMGLQERLALKAALGFMLTRRNWWQADFVGQEYEGNTELAKVVETVMMNLGMRIMQELLTGIGGRLPRSFGSQLIEVLYKLVSRYVEASRQWLQVLLAQENFPSPYVDQASKETFAKGIMGTRSPKRFREVVQEFSLKCRKLEDTAFGAAV
ncbi:armadillo-type protein [Endogone sp. FLAS-F59071]|nr:armadillo-type protein [Endogone sp. FLAS-F59071]|eukprot:RUS20345.1 armadillo-type protein [Endogone sp. FLAS-F59071]